MATPTVSAVSHETGAPGLRGTGKTEWIKITAAASTTGEPTAAYAFKHLKQVLGVIGSAGFSNTIDNNAKTVVFTPTATITGSFIVGLVGR